MSPVQRGHRAPRRQRRGCRPGSLLTLSLVLSCGCQGPNVQLTPQQQAQLEHRAMALLVRAAQSDLNVARANAIEALVDVAPDENLPVFRAAVTSESTLVRYAGCVALGEVRDSASLRAFRRLLEDPDARIRLAAAFAACRCGETNPRRVLVQTLNDHPDEKLRADAAYLIGKLGEPQAAKRLRLARGREKSNHVLLHILTALAMLGDEDARDALIYYTQSDTNSRLVALQALVELAPPRARTALLRLLNEESYYLQARLIAARALGKLGVDAGYDLAIKTLIRTADDENETMQIRVNAALALGAIGRPRALPALRRLAETEDDPRTQVATCYAICQIVRASRER
ncbi:MAG: HEAT repeat domain-containing protein [Phycisphaerae bacterium]